MSKIKIVFISLFAFVATLLSGVWIGNYSLMFTVPLFSSQNTIEVSNFSEHELRIQFERFIPRYTKSYVDSNEYEARFLIFKNNYRQIERHNSESIAHKYTLRMNKFGDLTREEFKNKYLGLLPSQGYSSKNSDSGSNTNKTITLKIPTSVDWREKGVVSGVKDQKSCKSGWAFSAISTIESAFRISGQGNDLLSEQQLIDWTDTSQSFNF